MKRNFKYPLDLSLIIILTILAILISFWLMFHTFSYNDGSFVIAVKVWSDFAGHIPLIRSFSFGSNLPPEYPLFSGEPLRYHFIFYLVVGILEKIGMPIDWALNLPSAISFAGLIIAVYLLATKLFKNKVVGILSVIFFLFNGSFSFLDFFKTHPLSLNTLNEIFTNTEYPSFAPYGPGTVSAFWNLNVYTNQRHLALPLVAFLTLILWIIYQEKKQQKTKIYLSSVIWGMFFGILLYAHSSIFIMAVLVLGILFLTLPKLRFSIFIIGVVGFMLALPRVLFLKETASFLPQLKLGYLISDKLTPVYFLKYWFLNLGLFTILLPVGFLLSSNLAKKVLIAFSSLFIIGNVIQFSPEIAGNHKFFNVFVIVGNMFVAFALVKLWKLSLVKFTVPVLIFFLIFSGIIDFFPLKNDRHLTIDDFPKNPDVAWIMNNTPKSAIFLNSSSVYHPASLAGRKIFYGWPYFAWSLGYDTQRRNEIYQRIFQRVDLKLTCSLLKENNIEYIDTIPTSDLNFKINYLFFENNFVTLYKNTNNNFTIYNVLSTCDENF